MTKETGSLTHLATDRGYAAGQLVEPGEFVPAGVPLGSWMEKVDAKEAKKIRAGLESNDPHPGDVDLTQLTLPALQAMAAERGVNVKGLNKDELIAGIKAARETDAG